MNERSRRESGWQYRLKLHGDLKIPAELWVWTSAQTPGDGANELKAQHEKDEHHTKNLPGAALRQPTLDPGKDHLHQDQVKQSERQQYQQRPREQNRAGNSNANKYPQQTDRSQ